jgi:hypothetical protein
VVRVTEPWAFTADSVYVVVCVGVTTRLEPEAIAGPGEIDIESAPVTTQLNVLELPLTIDAGAAVNDAMTGSVTGGGGVSTFTSMARVTDP